MILYTCSRLASHSDESSPLSKFLVADCWNDFSSAKTVLHWHLIYWGDMDEFDTQQLNWQVKQSTKGEYNPTLSRLRSWPETSGVSSPPPPACRPSPPAPTLTRPSAARHLKRDSQRPWPCENMARPSRNCCSGYRSEHASECGLPFSITIVLRSVKNVTISNFWPCWLNMSCHPVGLVWRCRTLGRAGQVVWPSWLSLSPLTLALWTWGRHCLGRPERI